MSGVPKSKRGQSSVEYVYNAQLLFHQTFEFALHLPKRWTFFLSERMVDHAEQVLHHAKSANSIYVSCAVDAQLRRLHLQQTYCHAQSLSSLIDEVFVELQVWKYDPGLSNPSARMVCSSPPSHREDMRI